MNLLNLRGWLEFMVLWICFTPGIRGNSSREILKSLMAFIFLIAKTQQIFLYLFKYIPGILLSANLGIILYPIYSFEP